ncbi:hypothetical protein VMCG_06897 [Cytospora schulzeri]|uniref:F-box domain-containing protein n=1 Tax=Cytospora schulzeri TaxID=448051 RepID=A0A423W1Z8_9PEZI|nr:hypothetical protein VMCG_06897 [Valsa malicola]
MDPDRPTTPAPGEKTDPLPLSPVLLSPSRVYMGLSNGIHKTFTSITEPFSTTRCEWDLLESATGQIPGTKERPSSHEPRNLMNIPPELHVVILQCLDFGDVQHLRRTCKYWYNFATPQLIQSIWGRDAFRAILTRHCKVCMRFCPKGATRLCTTPLDPGYPLSSRCVTCTVKARDGTFRLGRTVMLSNSVEYCICRWCGWPVTGTSGSLEYRQFHKTCYEKYFLGKLAFFFVRWFHLFIGVAAPALCWRYFRRDKMVLVPTIMGFLMMWLGVFVTGFQPNRIRVYFRDLVIEVIILGLWVAPVYSVSKRLVDGAPARSTQATIAFIGLNMLFRLLNIMGNIALLCKYDWTKHHVPGASTWNRVKGPMLMMLVMWTWPQCIERTSPRHFPISTVTIGSV